MNRQDRIHELDKIIAELEVQMAVLSQWRDAVRRELAGGEGDVEISSGDAADK